MDCPTEIKLQVVTGVSQEPTKPYLIYNNPPMLLAWIGAETGREGWRPGVKNLPALLQGGQHQDTEQKDRMAVQSPPHFLHPSVPGARPHFAGLHCPDKALGASRAASSSQKSEAHNPFTLLKIPEDPKELWFMWLLSITYNSIHKILRYLIWIFTILEIKPEKNLNNFFKNNKYITC